MVPKKRGEMGMNKRPLSLMMAAFLVAAWLLQPSSAAPPSPPAWQDSRDDTALLVAGKSRGPSARTSPTRKLPTLIQDIRVGPKATHTRVVLDLERQIAFTQTRRKNPDRVVIDLQHARLTKAAQAKLVADDFPSQVKVFQLRSGGVRVSLDLDVVSSYKLLPLTNPPRLVLDIFSLTHANGQRPETSSAVALSPAPPSLLAPPRPVGSEIKTIVIDPGHGGKDPGAIGRSGTREKDITLKVSLYLRDLIKKRMGKRVLMTRHRDEFVALEDRAEFANKHGADLFVSIHVNAHPKRSVKGLEIYYFGKASDRRAMEVAARENRENGIALDPDLEFILADLRTTKMVQDSLEFAWTTSERMVRRLDGRYKVANHGVKTAPFYVLRFTTMPSILAEIGYVSNPSEEKRLRSKAFRRQVAEAIFDGIKAYVNSTQVAAR